MKIKNIYKSKNINLMRKKMEHQKKMTKKIKKVKLSRKKKTLCIKK